MSRASLRVTLRASLIGTIVAIKGAPKPRKILSIIILFDI